MGNDRKRLPFLFLFFLGTSVIDIAGIGLVGPYIALVIDPEAYKKLPVVFDFAGNVVADREPIILIMGIGLVLLFALKTLVAILMNRTIFRFSHGRAAQLRIELMRTYVAMPYERYFDKNSAQMLQTAQDYVAQFIEQAVIPTLRFVSEGVICIVILGFLAWIHGYALALMVLMVVPVAVIYDKVFRHKMLTHGKEANLKMTIMLKALKEGVSGLKELRVLGASKYYSDMLEEGAKGNAEYVARSKTIMIAPRYLLELTLILFVVTLTVGTIYFKGSTDSILPVLGMFGVAAMRLIPSANLLIGGVSKLGVGRHATHMLYLDLSQLQKASVEPEPIPPLKRNADEGGAADFKSMELRGIHYRYPAIGSDALNGISLAFSRGESIGLVGRSGSGKTTLVDVMLGLLKHHKGEVLINGVPIENCLALWRSHVAYLPQQVFIADSSIRINVALGIPDSEIDDVTVWDALEQACLKDVVELMPKGIHTPLGEHGIRLSGGQRQRIALARAIYHNRDVLVMDESTSALDADTEKQIVESITTLRGKKTLIVIAHRISTVEQCDRVFRLEKGKIESCSVGPLRDGAARV